MKHVVRVILGAILFAFVYTLALRIVPPLAASLGSPQDYPWLFRTSLIPQLTFLILSLILMWAIGRGDFSSYGLKLVKPVQLIKPVLVAAVTMLVLMSPMIILTISGSNSEGKGPGPGKGDFGPQGLLHTIIFIWIIASICEEVFYRGLLQGFLAPLIGIGFRIRKVHISVPVILCALGFGLGHLCLRGMVPTPMLASIIVSATILGLIAGYFREKTGSLIPAIAAHMTFNIVGRLVFMLL